MKWRSGVFLLEYKFFGQKTCIFFFFFFFFFGNDLLKLLTDNERCVILKKSLGSGMW